MNPKSKNQEDADIVANHEERPAIKTERTNQGEIKISEAKIDDTNDSKFTAPPSTTPKKTKSETVQKSAIKAAPKPAGTQDESASSIHVKEKTEKSATKNSQIDGLRIQQGNTGDVKENEEQSGGRSNHKDNGAGPSGKNNKKVWNKGPLVQLCMVSVEDVKMKAIGFTLDTTPFDFSENKPIKHFKIISGKVQENSEDKFRQAARTQGTHKKKGKKNMNKEVVKIVTASIHAWERSTNIKKKPQCHCDEKYYNHQLDHSDQDYCVLNAIGAQIAEKIWEDQIIEGLEIDDYLLQ